MSIGFWIFMDILVVCVTIVAIIFICKYKVLHDWEYRQFIKEVRYSLNQIEKMLKSKESAGVDQ